MIKHRYDEMGFSIGIGLTNDCNLMCAHCYRDTEHVSSLNFTDVERICQSIPIKAMGLGTGENALHPEFNKIVKYLNSEGIRLSIASNGFSLTKIPDEILTAFQDVEVSIDFPSQPEQDAWRGDGNWDLVHKAIERCSKLGIEISILSTMMKPNYAKMDQMVTLARRDGVNLRVNAYQAVKSGEFRLNYDDFWEGYQRLFSEGLVISCSEPVVRAVMGFSEVHSPCGSDSIRFNPQGQVIPCVYWPTAGDSLPKLEDFYLMGSKVMENPSFKLAQAIPPSASHCPCQGGCASRRAINNQLDAHDDYCPWVRDDEMQLTWQSAPEKDLIRAKNVCTTIVA
jgi:MoaA/NifB/PqqE/SkfB family radical SAM enzyme